MNNFYLILIMITLAQGCGSANVDYRNPGCQTNKSGNIVTIQCYNGRSATVQDSQSIGFPNESSVVNLVSPCNQSVSASKELLILMKNDVLYRAYPDSNGIYGRLSTLEDGTYSAYEDPDCTYRVSTINGQRSVIWSGGGNVF